MSHECIALYAPWTNVLIKDNAGSDRHGRKVTIRPLPNLVCILLLTAHHNNGNKKPLGQAKTACTWCRLHAGAHAAIM